MIMLGRFLADYNCVLRSGAADGADAAFETGCDEMKGDKEIYLPWKQFNKHPSQLHEWDSNVTSVAERIYGKSKWKRVSPLTKKFMSRNCQQVGGMNLDIPSNFVICWTKDGCDSDHPRTRNTGGTGQAIQYALELNIPVFNLYHPATLNVLMEYIRNEVVHADTNIEL